MHTRLKSMAMVAAITIGSFVGAYAQSPGFFGSGSNAAGTVPTATPSQPSPSQVMSNGDFTKKTDALKTQNEAQYQKDFNAKLKPMPSQGGASSSSNKTVIPVPAGSSPAPNTSAPAAAPATAPASTAPASSTGAGYTGFVGPKNNDSTSTTTPTKSSGWGVTY